MGVLYQIGRDPHSAGARRAACAVQLGVNHMVAEILRRWTIRTGCATKGDMPQNHLWRLGEGDTVAFLEPDDAVGVAVGHIAYDAITLFDHPCVPTGVADTAGR